MWGTECAAAWEQEVKVGEQGCEEDGGNQRHLLLLGSAKQMPEVGANTTMPHITASFNSELSSYARRIQSTKLSVTCSTCLSPDQHIPHHEGTVDLVLVGRAALGNDICHHSTAGTAGETLLCMKYQMILNALLGR